MATARWLRFALVLQAATLALAIAAPLPLAGKAVIDRVSGSCTDVPCGPGALVFGYMAFTLGGPLWWAIAGTGRAGLPHVRQLAWLVVVDAYLVVIGGADAVLDRKTTSDDLRFLFVAVSLGVVLTALISFAACATRIWELRAATRLSR